MADAIWVTIVSAKGSTPREAGATMVVDADGTQGTIGGGRLEFDAISTAREMLHKGETAANRSVSLGPQISQCCGGHVVLAFTPHEPRSAPLGRKPLHIFGGGHVGRALVSAFAPLPFDITVIEPRADFLLGFANNVQTKLLAAPEAAVRSAPSGTCFIVTTHEHSLDFLIVEEVLRRGDAAYIGMIGSVTKRSVLENRLRNAGIDPAPLVCPIGAGGIGDKRPEVIAAFTAPEVLAAVKGVS